MWTSFLKARLVCGFPEESLYFNRLLDVYMMQAEDWQDTRVYALFTSSWCDTFPSFYYQQLSVNNQIESSAFAMFWRKKLTLACKF